MKKTTNNLKPNVKIIQTINHYFTPCNNSQLSVKEYHKFMRLFVGKKYNKSNSILHMAKYGYIKQLKVHKGVNQYVFMVKIKTI